MQPQPNPSLTPCYPQSKVQSGRDSSPETGESEPLQGAAASRPYTESRSPRCEAGDSRGELGEDQSATGDRWSSGARRLGNTHPNPGSEASILPSIFRLFQARKQQIAQLSHSWQRRKDLVSPRLKGSLGLEAIEDPVPAMKDTAFLSDLLPPVPPGGHPRPGHHRRRQGLEPVSDGASTARF